MIFIIIPCFWFLSVALWTLDQTCSAQNRDPEREDCSALWWMTCESPPGKHKINRRQSWTRTPVLMGSSPNQAGLSSSLHPPAHSHPTTCFLSASSSQVGNFPEWFSIPRGSNSRTVLKIKALAHPMWGSVHGDPYCVSRHFLQGPGQSCIWRGFDAEKVWNWNGRKQKNTNHTAVEWTLHRFDGLNGSFKLGIPHRLS